MGILKWFRDRFKFRPRVIILREKSTKWTEEDSFAWGKFLETETGKKILIMSDDFAINRNRAIAPATTPHRIVYEKGVADGIIYLLHYFKSLSPGSQLNQRDETEQELNGETSFIPETDE